MTYRGETFHLPEEIFNEYIYRNHHIEPFIMFMDFFDGNIDITRYKKLIDEIDINGGPRMYNYLCS